MSDSRETVFVLVNRKSGGQRGATILAEFQAALPPENVADIIATGPLHLLNHALAALPSASPAVPIRILVAGGDGTVDWALSVMESELSAEQRDKIALAHIPLGTGNDMARSTGWGGGYDGGKTGEMLDLALKAHAKPLDRWKVAMMEGENNSLVKVFANYFSVGADAAVAYNFHHLRESKPNLFRNRLVNKVWYGTSGCKAVAQGRAYALSKHFVVTVDGAELRIPFGVKTILLLNIPSYMGGADVWNQKKARVGCFGAEYEKQESGDGMLEIIGFGGPFRQGAVRIFKLPGQRLAQGSNVTIETQRNGSFAQVDGEPWQVDGHYRLDVEQIGRVAMLVRQ